MTFNKTGTLLAIGGANGKIAVYDFPSITLKYTLSVDNFHVRDLLFYQNDSKLISAGNNDKIFIWNLDTRLVEKTMTGHTGHIGSLDLNSSGSLLVSGSYEDQSMKLWNPATAAIDKTITIGANISNVSFDSDDNLYFSCFDGYFRMYSRTGTILFETRPGNGSKLAYSSFLESQKIVVSYCAEGVIKVMHNEPVWLQY